MIPKTCFNQLKNILIDNFLNFNILTAKTQGSKKESQSSAISAMEVPIDR